MDKICIEVPLPPVGIQVDKSYRELLWEFEKEVIETIMFRCKGNKLLASKRYKINRNTLSKKLKKMEKENV